MFSISLKRACNATVIIYDISANSMGGGGGVGIGASVNVVGHFIARRFAAETSGSNPHMGYKLRPASYLPLYWNSFFSKNNTLCWNAELQPTGLCISAHVPLDRLAGCTMHEYASGSTRYQSIVTTDLQSIF
jgi:hypothetical protein